jgi:hypothetical protein
MAYALESTFQQLNIIYPRNDILLLKCHMLPTEHNNILSRTLHPGQRSSLGPASVSLIKKTIAPGNIL